MLKYWRKVHLHPQRNAWGTYIMHALENLTASSLCGTGDAGTSGNHCSENFPAASEDRSKRPISHHMIPPPRCSLLVDILLCSTVSLFFFLMFLYQLSFDSMCGCTKKVVGFTTLNCFLLLCSSHVCINHLKREPILLHNQVEWNTLNGHWWQMSKIVLLSDSRSKEINQWQQKQRTLSNAVRVVQIC